MLICILKTKKKWLSVLKGINDARIKVDKHTKDDVHMAWHGINDDLKFNFKSLFHYGIVLEKYDKLVKTRKLAKFGNIGPSSL